MAKSIDSTWHRGCVLAYRQVLPHYCQYAETLASILKQACRLYAPLGIVQARAKSIASFAEKAARKAHKYDDPVHQLTDLCGARVVTSTTDELKAMCGFIEQSFVIDWANSVDAGTRLRDEEFGYQSVHYIVQVAMSEILGVAVPLDKIGQRKAEIQIRTVTQHAWASITHDRLYKSSFNVPVRLKRLAHRTAALLEEADEALNTFEAEVQAYLGTYAAYLKPGKLHAEIDIVSVVLAAEPVEENKPAIALRLARLLRAAGQLDGVIATLACYEELEGPLQLPILVELGSALLERNGPDDPERGRRLLGKITKPDDAADARHAPVLSVSDRKLLASAEVMRAAAERDHRAKTSLYTRALELDPADPYILCAQLAYSISRTSQHAAIDSARPGILDAIRTCRAHINAGLQLPAAWFTTAHFYLLLGQDLDSLDYYCRAIRFYLSDSTRTWPDKTFQAEIDFLTQMGNAAESAMPQVEWAKELLLIGHWLNNDGSLPNLKARRKSPRFGGYDAGKPVVIIAGDARPAAAETGDRYFDLIKAALDGFQGTVISGGTTAGIPGAVGRAARDLNSAGRKTFQLIGYHPKSIPATAQLSSDYDHQIASGEADYRSLGEPLQIWLDLLAAGVAPRLVRVLGIGGGRISRFEYALGLAFGGLIGLVESSGRSADETLRDADWSVLPTLLPLPNDPLTAQAFVQGDGGGDLSPEELERMARVAHEMYRRGMKPDYKKPNTLPWDALPEYYRESSCAQVAYMFHAMKSRGYEIDRATGTVQPFRIPEEQIEPLAEMEHGRWNYERLRSGWRRDSEKNDERRRTPYLVAWRELSDAIKEYDRNAVREFPHVLAEGGYELHF
jgi:ppGpp synthetase/RelA/SpoT-type nucleotidyltranferase